MQLGVFRLRHRQGSDNPHVSQSRPTIPTSFSVGSKTNTVRVKALIKLIHYVLTKTEKSGSLSGRLKVTHFPTTLCPRLEGRPRNPAPRTAAPKPCRGRLRPSAKTRLSRRSRPHSDSASSGILLQRNLSETQSFQLNWELYSTIGPASCYQVSKRWGSFSKGAKGRQAPGPVRISIMTLRG